MKLALLGFDPDMLNVLLDIATHTPHEVVWASGLNGHEREVRAVFPRVRVDQDWELLLGGTIADAVLVARHSDQEVPVEQLRKLLQSEIPALVAHPICQSMLLAYELEMIRASTHSVLLPYLPARLHPEVAEWQRILQEEGDVEQITCERAMSDRSRAAVTAQFARDVDLLQALAGELNKISAHGRAEPETAYANLAVQMSGESKVPMRWTVGPEQGKMAGRLTMIRPHRPLIAQLGGGVNGTWHEVHTADKVAGSDFSAWSAAGAMLEQFELAVQGEPHQAATWNDACRSIEMAETIERCLKKGRTVDLHHENFSEESTFKGTMTSLGCGLLVVGVIIAFAFAILQAFCRLVGWNNAAQWLNQWPYYLVALLVVFLVLQSLLVLTRTQKDPLEVAEKEADPETSPSDLREA